MTKQEIKHLLEQSEGIPNDTTDLMSKYDDYVYGWLTEHAVNNSIHASGLSGLAVNNENYYIGEIMNDDRLKVLLTLNGRLPKIILNLFSINVCTIKITDRIISKYLKKKKEFKKLDNNKISDSNIKNLLTSYHHLADTDIDVSVHCGNLIIHRTNPKYIKHDNMIKSFNVILPNFIKPLVDIVIKYYLPVLTDVVCKIADKTHTLAFDEGVRINHIIKVCGLLDNTDYSDIACKCSNSMYNCRFMKKMKKILSKCNNCKQYKPMSLKRINSGSKLVIV